MSNEYLNIGNVKFLKEDVDLQRTTTKMDGNKKINCVFLKNGTQLEFQDQNINNKAMVETGHYGDEGTYGKDNGTGFLFIDGLKVKGTDKSEFYHFWECTNWDVDTSRGGNDEIRAVGKTKHVTGVINADYSDKISFLNFDKQKWMSMNEGWFFKVGPQPEQQEIQQQQSQQQQSSQGSVHILQVGHLGWKKEVSYDKATGDKIEKSFNKDGRLMQLTRWHDKNGDKNFGSNEIKYVDKYEYTGDGKGKVKRSIDDDYKNTSKNDNCCDRIITFEFDSNRAENKVKKISEVKVSTNASWEKHNNKMSNIDKGRVVWSAQSNTNTNTNNNNTGKLSHEQLMAKLKNIDKSDGSSVAYAIKDIKANTNSLDEYFNTVEEWLKDDIKSIDKNPVGIGVDRKYELKNGETLWIGRNDKNEVSIAISRPKYQLQEMYQNGKLVMFHRPYKGCDGHGQGALQEQRERYEDTDGDGYADKHVIYHLDDYKEIIDSEETLPDINKMKQEAGNDGAKNFPILARLMYNLLNNGSNGKSPVCI